MSDHDKLREAITEVRQRMAGNSMYVGNSIVLVRDIEQVLAAAESTLPKTKMVEVWHSEWCWRNEPKIAVHFSQAAAIADADHLRRLNEKCEWSCIRVTGPHQQEVPA